MHDLVLTGGRVIDPEWGLDAVRDVGNAGDTVNAISAQPLRGRQILDVSELVVAPGFIDLHSHCHEISGQRLQVFDGVTTSLELEAGVHPVDVAYARAAREGRPVNYGFSASWAATRMNVLGGTPPPTGTLGDILPNLARDEWQREANPGQVDAILGPSDLEHAKLGLLAGLGDLNDAVRDPADERYRGSRLHPGKVKGQGGASTLKLGLESDGIAVIEQAKGQHTRRPVRSPVGSVTPTPSTIACSGNSAGSLRSWITTPPTGASGFTSPATTSSRVGPRWSMTRPRVAMGRCSTANTSGSYEG